MTPFHRTRETVAVEPSLCPSKFQDLADPEPLETEVAPASKAATRAARPSTDCSMFEILFVIDAMYIEITCGDFPIFVKRITSIRVDCRQCNRKYGEQFGSVCQLVLSVEIQGPTWHVRLISVMGHSVSVGRKHAFGIKREEHTTLPTQLRTYNGRAESHSWNIAADRERGPPPADAQSTETHNVLSCDIIDQDITSLRNATSLNNRRRVRNW